MNNNDCINQKEIRRIKNLIIIIQISILITFILLWEILAHFNIINSFLVSRPSKIAELFWKYLINNEIWKHSIISIVETLLGLSLGTILGLLIAFIIWYFPILEKIVKPYMNMLNCLPKTALAPIIIIWVGTGIEGIVVVAITILIIVTILSAYNYFNNVDSEKIKMFKSFNASKFKTFYKLVLPSNLENIFSIIKINLGLSWVGVIVGEFLVSKKGIGYLIMYGGQVFQLDLVMMGVFILSIFAFLMYIIIEKIEKLIMKGRGL